MSQDSSKREASFPILTFVPGTATAFVAQWSQWYSYPREELYTSNIGQSPVPKRIHELFEWKNGGKLSRSKLSSIDRYYASRCAELRKLPSTTTAEEFLGEFGGGPIWRIFLLHCWGPTRFPIYDQHVHRAMEFIQTGTVREISQSPAIVLRDYIDKYLLFWQQFSGTSDRKVDKALWAFGKLLKQFPSGIRHGHP